MNVNISICAEDRLDAIKRLRSFISLLKDFSDRGTIDFNQPKSGEMATAAPPDQLPGEPPDYEVIVEAEL